jgi:exopolyphosphatase/guanosine-5'-triphosphate,3'-diphosphate pyrophosphatase
MEKNIIAAIDVGSHALQMKIGELKKNGSFRELENFRKIVVLGHDTFTTNKISFQSVDKTCNILKAFNNIMNDYGIEIYKAMATSAVREAANKDYILDQIKLQTGLNIEVISNSQEQYLTHKAVKCKLDKYNEKVKEGAVIIVIGAGSIQITTYKEGKLQSSQNVKMGALRVKEIIGSLEDETLKYYKILNEYIEANLEGVDFFDQEIEYKHFIAVGGEISIISEIINSNSSDDESISIEDFDNLFNKLLVKNIHEIIEEYNIKKERAEIIIPSMMLFKKFGEGTNSKKIVVPNISLTDGIVRDIYEEIYRLKEEDKTVEDIITNAEVLAKKFQYNEKHCKAVESNSLILFDKLKKLHGLEEERVLLRTAAILHDIGKYIGLDRHYVHSYSIIKSLEIFGLSSEQMEIIANISRYHSTVVPSEIDSNFTSLCERDRVLVAKLIAIIRLADALDRSHKQKIKVQSVKIKGKNLVIKGVSNMNTTLEEWTFKKKAFFFEEVFGITPTLKIKKEI